MNKAIFLDRDGTINVEKHYLYRIEDFEFIEGVKEALKLFCDHGFKLIIITNQSGIARGYFSERDYDKLMFWLQNELLGIGVKLSGIYFCPHLNDAPIKKYRKNCNCRKPHTGLFYKAIQEHCIDLKGSFCIGDKLRDLSICEDTDCKGYLIGNNEDDEIIEGVKNSKYRNINYAENLIKCANIICG